jgi:hypothetical protein
MSDPKSNQPFGRVLAKFVIDGAISYKVTQITKNAISDYTRFEGDSLAVNIAAGTVGFVVSTALEPLTSKAVDVTFDFVSTQHKKFKDRRKNDNTE